MRELGASIVRLMPTVMPECPSLGFAATEDEAKRDLAATWRRWLAMHGKDEATHRPFYGSPASIRCDATPYSWLPGTGLNLMPRNATPTGSEFAALMVIAVQTMLVDVAAIAVVPTTTAPVSRT